MIKVERKEDNLSQSISHNTQPTTTPRNTFAEFEDLDESDNEIWLMQCPEDTDLVTLQGHKLKFPGRSNIDEELEAIALEHETPQTLSFGYQSRDGEGAIRLLPIKGNIMVRSRLKVNPHPTVDDVLKICPPMGRVPFPKIKQRHPLLGANYAASLKMSKTIANKLKEADMNSTQIMKDARLAKRKHKLCPTEIVVKTEKVKKEHRSQKLNKTIPQDEHDLKWIREF